MERRCTQIAVPFPKLLVKTAHLKTIHRELPDWARWAQAKPIVHFHLGPGPSPEIHESRSGKDLVCSALSGGVCPGIKAPRCVWSLSCANSPPSNPPSDVVLQCC